MGTSVLRPQIELANVGWWEDHGQHFQIVHHIGYQRTRERSSSVDHQL